MRFTGIRLVVAVSVAASLFAVSGAPTAAAETQTARPPNILIILSDDQRYDAMGVMDQTRAWFEAGGTRYTNAFATTPLCCPSRSSIMSGQYAHNHGVTSNVKAAEFDHDASVQAHLRAAGYTTAIAGKFLNGWDVTQDPPHFDRWSIFKPGNERTAYWGSTFNTNGEVAESKQYSTDFVAERAVDFLGDFEQNDDKPWFLFVTPTGPHRPYLPEPDYADAPVPARAVMTAVGERDRNDKPRYVREHSLHHAASKGAADYVGQQRLLMSVDDLVGDIHEQLTTLGEDSNTLAFYLSDNGYLMGEHGLLKKSYPYLESVRVPMYAWWPGHVAAGATSDELVANIDLAPTIFDAAGVAFTSHPFDGRSLFAGINRSHLLLEYPDGIHAPAWASVVTKQAQYIETYDDKGRLVFQELYDRAADPAQLSNLLADGGVDTSQLSRTVAAARACAGATCP